MGERGGDGTGKGSWYRANNGGFRRRRGGAEEATSAAVAAVQGEGEGEELYLEKKQVVVVDGVPLRLPAMWSRLPESRCSMPSGSVGSKSNPSEPHVRFKSPSTQIQTNVCILIIFYFRIMILLKYE
jgi:hypothetical protein